MEEIVPILTEEQEANYEIVKKFLCSGSPQKDDQDASAAMRDLMADLGREHGAHIISVLLKNDAISAIEGTAGSYPRASWLNKAFIGVKKGFIKALHDRMVRKLVLSPLIKFIHKISDSWSYPRAVLIGEDIEGLRQDFGDLGYPADVPTEEVIRKLEHYKHLLKVDKEFGNFFVDSVLAGKDIYHLRHPSLNTPFQKNKKAQKLLREDDEEPSKEIKKRPRKDKKSPVAKKNSAKKTRVSRPKRKTVKPSVIDLVQDEDDEEVDARRRIEDEIDKFLAEESSNEDQSFVAKDDDPIDYYSDADDDEEEDYE